MQQRRVACPECGHEAQVSIAYSLGDVIELVEESITAIGEVKLEETKEHQDMVDYYEDLTSAKVVLQTMLEKVQIAPAE